MDFIGDVGLWQRRVAECPEGIARRIAVIEALQPRKGWRVLDVGCGGGHLVREMARAVGGCGEAVGVDMSAEMLKAAGRLCADAPNASVHVADVAGLPMPADTFDAISSIQTLEYVADVDGALGEIRRVARVGARAAFVSVLWDTFRHHGPEAVLNDRILDAWRAHCPHQMLPAEMPARLGEAGFDGAVQRPLTIFNASFHENCYSFWAAKVMANFAVVQGVDLDDAERWLEQLEAADRNGRFCFVSVPVLTTCVAV